MEWFAIRTKPSSESIAASYLRSWVDEVYMPVCERATMLDLTRPDPTDEKKVRRLCVGTQRVLMGPILRGYIFAKLDMSQRAANEIALTRGVLCLVPNNFRPEPVSDEAFERLRKCCDALASAGETNADYSHMVGKIWRVKGGTYAGYQGECDHVVKDFAVLKLGMFKSEIPVPVLVSDIEVEPLGVAIQEAIEGMASLRYKNTKNSRKRGALLA